MTTPITHLDLTRAYDRTGWAARGISLDEAMAAPDLSAGLRAVATAHAHRIARLAAHGTGARIERTTPATDD